jgi:DNA-damage-inducible protein J
MNAHTSMLHVRIDDDLKARANEALSAMGLSASDAVRLLFHRIAVDQAFPLELKVPNAQTRAAIEEARDMIAKDSVRYDDPEILTDVLTGASITKPANAKTK